MGMLVRGFVLLLLLTGLAWAYDGPLVAPPPRVNDSAGPVHVGPGCTRTRVSWDLQGLAAQAAATHAFLEVKYGSDFSSNTGLTPADQQARVLARGDLPLRGELPVDFAAFDRGPGDYFVRVVAKRGGNTPQHDVTRRSPSVRVLRGSVPLRLVVEPVRATVTVPSGRTSFTAVVSGAPPAVDWTSDAGTIVPDAPGRVWLQAPASAPSSLKRIRVEARLRANPAITSAAEATVMRQLGTPPGGATPRPGPEPMQVLDRVRVTSLTAERVGPGVRARMTIRNDHFEGLNVPWSLTVFGDVPDPQIANGTVFIPGRSSVEVTGARPQVYQTSFRVAGRVDIANTLGEEEAYRQNNYQVVTVGTADSVALVGLTTSPNPPRPGYAFSLVASVRNVGERDLTNVTWGVLEGGNLLAQDRISVPRGRTQEIRIPVTAGPGTHAYEMAVDPNNDLGESPAGQENNVQRLTVNVPAAQPPAQVERWLDPHQVERLSGIHFRSNFDGLPGQAPTETRPSGVRGAVLFGTDPPSVSLGVKSEGLLGVKASPEAYADFELRNGWRISAVEVDEAKTLEGQDTDMGVTFRWLDGPPAVGSTRPYLKARVSAEGGLSIFVTVRIRIKGPANRSPYE